MDTQSRLPKISLRLVCNVALLCVLVCASHAHPDAQNDGEAMSHMAKSSSRLRILKRLVGNKRGQASMELAPPPAETQDADWLELLSSPEALDDFVEMLHLLQIPLDAVVPDLPPVVQSELHGLQQEKTHPDMKGVFRLDRYHPLHEITAWMRQLEAKHADIIKIVEIGKSYEGRPLMVAKLGLSRDPFTPKPAIWMDAGIHSNEWIGPATMLYFINQLVSGSSESVQMLKEFDWYIMPVFNVDGYEYTWNADRLWRKSRSEPVPESGCKGVDLNRNWAPSTRPVDSNPCSRTFPGKQPLSEPETVAVSQFLEQHNDSLVAYLAYHAFSQMWMTPYAYTMDRTPDHFQQMVSMAEEITDAIRNVHGTQYKVGTVARLIGETDGSSVDFTYRQLGIPFSFGVELRDNGRYGTLLPPDQILPNCEESWAGVVRMAQLLPKASAGQKRIPPEI